MSLTLRALKLSPTDIVAAPHVGKRFLAPVAALDRLVPLVRGELGRSTHFTPRDAPTKGVGPCSAASARFAALRIGLLMSRRASRIPYTPCLPRARPGSLCRGYPSKALLLGLQSMNKGVADDRDRDDDIHAQ